MVRTAVLFYFQLNLSQLFCFTLFTFLLVLRRHLSSVGLYFFLRFTKSTNVVISCSWVKPKFELHSQAEILSKIPSSCSKSTDVATINLFEQTLIIKGISSNLIFLIFYWILHSAEQNCCWTDEKRPDFIGIFCTKIMTN